MSILDIKVFFTKIKRLKDDWNKQDEILDLGLNSFAPILSYFFPLILTVILFTLSILLDLSIKRILQNIISSIPSLLGFLIAAATIIISISNSNLDKKMNNSPYSYKQVGSAIFFSATKNAFILLIIAFLTPDTFPIKFILYKEYFVFFISIIIFWILSKLLVYIFYGLVFLSSSMETKNEIKENI
ncbi:hypothetical protein ACN9J3_04900 [Aliarcobacter butzleri]|uniref:hypothetical protein n=1 Tax=Aliarcobacter butzleri TaxID=28197 RepID=UPI003B21C515